ncbi:MAG: T9SS type A sorting domain-containing protein [Bacteroidota bacterium]
MKKQLIKKGLWPSFLSIIVLGVFILLATGSLEFLNDKTEYLGDGVYESTEYYEEDSYEKTTGKQDDKGRWHGPVTIRSRDEGGFSRYSTEEVNMVNGKRHGRSKITFWDILGREHVYYNCYNMGERVDCGDAGLKSVTELTSYDVLKDQYPYLLVTMEVFGFDSAYVNSYLDTLEMVLGTYEFEDYEFDDYYSEVINELEETRFDSMIAFNEMNSLYRGVEEIKNDELRQAVMDRYRSNGMSTYAVVETTYPGYLLLMNSAGVNDPDFEEFCRVLDSCMTSYGLLDLEDPFFIDSVDVRIYRALSVIMESEEDNSSSLKSLRSKVLPPDHLSVRRVLNEARARFTPFSVNSSPGEVSSVALAYIILQLDQGDLIKRAVREAYLTNKGVISIPTVTTEFGGNNSATSVTLRGYVIHDGGDGVSSRGIAWATFYNPTTGDQSDASGEGTGSFEVTLTGLAEGATYYARTYATNSAGTAYGNCISFTASGTSGVDEITASGQELHIYPNPASAFATVIFQVETSEVMVLSIVDMKGRVVYRYEPGILPSGESRLELDLSGFQEGVYLCQLTINGKTSVIRNFVIAR